MAYLSAIERKVLWLAAWMIHHANRIRSARDGLKVGGHQASSASLVTVLTALYFDILRPEDRVAVKPHAGPAYHAIQYLFGRQTLDQLQRFRGFGGAQAYPSRTKDIDAVDFSTGSMGLGVAMTTFATLVQEYVVAKRFVATDRPRGRMVALLGDAELDEGNVFEALLEGCKHGLRNLWWIVDFNRQSLDAIAPDRMHARFAAVFSAMDWRVVTLKYGTLLQEAFSQPGGDVLRQWLDDCSNANYSALMVQGGPAWRRQLLRDLDGVSGLRQLLDERSDEDLHRLMTNLAGHDLASLLAAFDDASGEQPTCFLTYTIKGYGLPMAGHKDNHAGLMTQSQVEALKLGMGVSDGEEWEPFAGLEIEPAEMQRFIASTPFASSASRLHTSNTIAVPAALGAGHTPVASTQDGFGRLLVHIAREHPQLADRIVTTAPDVAVSTNLGPWVNQRGVFALKELPKETPDLHMTSAQRWVMSPNGQHIELGIAENNLFILLAALGLSGALFDAPLLPIGTVYDPFVSRGLDALNYACYQDARFILVATPSGITLGPEGGAHQSVITPLIGIGQPGLTAFEPAYVDELAEMLRWSLGHLQQPDGGSVYLKLSTRPLAQPERTFDQQLARDVIEGGYWLIPPAEPAGMAVVCCGAVVAEAIEAHTQLLADLPGTGLLVITSADRLHRGWLQSLAHWPTHVRLGGESEEAGGSSVSHVERLLARLHADAGLITVLDGHPATLSWLGAVRRQRVVPLGVDRFGQSGDIPDLYRAYGVDVAAVIDATARLCLPAAFEGWRQHVV